MKAWVVSGVILLAIGCQPIPMNSVSKQGISGQVYWLEGNFMPAIGPAPSGTKTPVIRELLFYKALDSREFKETTGPIYTTLPGNPLAHTMSDSLGQFRIELPEGVYSVFTKEPGGLFANSFDRNGIINPVDVKAGIFSEINIEINYKAVF